MCGIVGAVAERNVTPILLEGLRRLEYRGYDSAGLVTLDMGHHFRRARALGKVSALASHIAANPITGSIGIAHTRWATHGAPSERNAHPHVSGDRLAVVHNGIIENHAELRQRLLALGYIFTSETDTEVAAHWIEHHRRACADLLEAVRRAVRDFEGAYALGVIAADEPGRIIAARKGSPLVVGLGLGENFIASDSTALLPVTHRFVYLEDGDIADVRGGGVRIFEQGGGGGHAPRKGIFPDRRCGRQGAVPPLHA